MKKILFTLALMLLTLVMALAVDAEPIKKGESVSLPVNIEKEALDIKAGSITFSYDENALELTEGQWTLSALLSSFDADSERGVIGFKNPTAISGNCFNVTLKVKENAEYKTYPVTVHFEFENSDLNQVKRDVVLEIEVFCPHASLSTVKGNKPSCTATGLTDGVLCDDCGRIVEKQEIINKLPHTFTLENVTADTLKEEASCTHPAIYYYSCSDCTQIGDTTFEYGNKLPHTFDKKMESDYYRITEGSCTIKPTYYYSCECGETGNDAFEGASKPHVFDRKARGSRFVNEAPDCNNGGSYYYSCACGEKGSELFEVGPLEHEAERYSYNNDATCVKNGTKTGVCIRCEKTFTIEDTEHKGSHEMGNWEVEVRPDYENEGKKVRFCKHCNGEREEGKLDKLIKPVTQTNKAENAPSVVIKGDISNTILNEEERTMVELGEILDTRLEISEIEASVSETEKELVEKEIGNLKESGDKKSYKVGMYLDISMFKNIGNRGETSVKDLNGEMELEIEVPKNLKGSFLTKRSYKLIHIHNGEAEALDCSYNKDNGTISFKTKGFSTYAIVYTDSYTSVIMVGAIALGAIVLIVFVAVAAKKKSKKRKIYRR